MDLAQKGIALAQKINAAPPEERKKLIKELVITYETNNKLMSNPKTQQLLSIIRKHLNITPSDYEQMFNPDNIAKLAKTPQDTKALAKLENIIKKNPEKAYKSLYNIYTYSQLPVEAKAMVRPFVSLAKKSLYDKGIDPATLLQKDSAPIKALNFIGNVLSVPANLVAKGTQLLWENALEQNGMLDKNREKRQWRVWGGDGWVSVLENINRNQKMQNILKKIHNNIPLTPEEKKVNQDYNKKFFWWGNLANFALDPLNFIPVGKATEVAKVGDTLDALKTTTKLTKNLLMAKGIKDTSKIGKGLNKILKLTPEAIKKVDDIKPFLNTVEQAKKIISVSGDVSNAKKIGEALFKIGKDVEKAKKAERFLNNPIVKFKAKAREKVGNVMRNIAEKTGIRKAFIGDMPTKLLDKAGEKIAGNPNQVANEVRRLGEHYYNKTADAITEINKEAKKLYETKFKERFTPKQFQEVFADAVEMPARAADNGFNPEDIKKVKDYMDNLLLEEAKYAGGKTSPLGLSEDLVKKWKRTANEYSKTFYKNEFDPALQKKETVLKDLLKKRTQEKPLLTDVVMNTEQTPEYLPHVLSKEAREFFNKQPQKHKKEIIETISKRLKQIKSGYQKQRKYTDSILDINRESREGNIIKPVLDNNGKVIREGFKGDLFTTDISKILAARSVANTRTIEQGFIAKKMLPFVSDVKLPGTVLLKGNYLPVAMRNVYAHPDVARYIDNFFKITYKTPSILLNTINKVERIWKAATLNFPTTVIRNGIGNVLNSLLALKDIKPNTVAKFLKSNADAINALRHIKDEKFLNETVRLGNKVMKWKDVLEAASKQGLFNTNRLAVHTAIHDFHTLGEITGKARPSLMKANQRLEEISRLALFIDQLKDGKTIKKAAETVYKVLFDYGDMTKFERGVRVVIPFFTWTRKNIPLQIENLLSSPSRAMAKLFHYGNVPQPTGGAATDERQMSEWLKTMPSVKTGKNQYLLLEGLFPYFDIARIARMLNLKKGIRPAIDEIVSDVFPLFKTPVENLANYNFTFKKPISRSIYDKKEFLGRRMNPYVVNFLNDWRYLTTLNRGDIGRRVSGETMTHPQKAMSKALVSWLFFAPYKYKPLFSRAMKKRDIKATLQKELINYSVWIKRLLPYAQSGKLKPKDVEDIRNRAKKILMLINEAYSKGTFDEKDKKRYTKWLINTLIRG